MSIEHNYQVTQNDQMDATHTTRAWLLLVPLLLVVSLCVLLEPSWMTNDDAAMSMIAHGYGGIADASSKLIFSNIVWGEFIQALPTIGGLYGYSLATLLVIVLSGVSAALVLNAHLPAFTTALLLTIALVQAILFPQFTITAGLITVASILLLKHSEHRDTAWLVVACACLFIGFIIRRPEMMLVCAVALSLIPWKSLIRQARFCFASGITAVVIIGAAVVDHNSYDKPEWERYQTLLPSVLPLVAYDALPQILAQPELLEKHDYSENDIRLIERWMWFDSDIASVTRLNALTADIGATTNLPIIGNSRITENLQESVLASFMALFNKDILFLVLASLLILTIKPSKSLFIAWGVFLIALIFMGAVGRPGELRVYIPVINLLMLAPLIDKKPLLGLRLATLTFGLALLVALSTIHHINASLDRQNISEKLRDRFTNLPKNQMIAGYYSSLKANHIFSVTGAANISDNFNNLYLFGWPAVTPYSVSYKADANDMGFEQQFKSKNGIWMLINNERLLEKYCSERNRTLVKLNPASGATGLAKKLSCALNN